jgi:hypothetical protein
MMKIVRIDRSIRMFVPLFIRFYFPFSWPSPLRAFEPVSLREADPQLTVARGILLPARVFSYRVASVEKEDKDWGKKSGQTANGN